MSRLAARTAALVLVLPALLLSGAARASVNAGQILVKTDDTERLTVAVRQYLEGWAAREGVRESPWFVPEAGGRRIVILPAKDGWATVLEATQVTADPTLAEALSNALGTRVIWHEVMGGALSWRYVVLQDGKIVATHAEPSPGYGAMRAEGEPEYEMPKYRDVEKLAWKLMAEEGVTRAYRFLAQDAVEVAADPKTGPQAHIFKVVPEGRTLKVGEGSFGFTLPDRGRQAPTPVESWLPVDMGAEVGGEKKMGIDLVRISGTPTEARVKNLAEVLQRMRRRYMQGQDGIRYCQLVPDRYRLEVYGVLATQGGACSSVYRKLLSKAQEDARKGEGSEKPPAITPSAD